MNRKHTVFDSNTNFVLFIKQEETPPTLSEEALRELDVAHSNAHFNRDGWTLFDWQIKKALIQERLLIKLIRLKSKGEDSTSVWEAIHFLHEWVCDIHPFKDNLPD